MIEVCFDAETTTLNSGNPFDPRNKLCTIGFLIVDSKAGIKTYEDFSIEYNEEPYGDKLKRIQEIIDTADLLIGFNEKFDMHWVRRYGIKFDDKRVWDCQLVYYMLHNQLTPYPSLNDALKQYGLPEKLDVVKTEYWEKGYDTTDVPLPILLEYQKWDVEGTYEVYLRQTADVAARGFPFTRLVSLHNQDLLVLEEMEHNGMVYNQELSIEKGKELEREIERIDETLAGFCEFHLPKFSSPEFISRFLYGGPVKFIEREDYEFRYKSGKTAIKQRNVEKEYVFPRRLEPLENSQLKKEGIFQTDAETLTILRAKAKREDKKIIDLLLERAKCKKIMGTYFLGLPKRIEEMGWEHNMIHGNLNQCRTVTGRLSSDKPNLQNFSGDVKVCFESRYP